MKFLNKLYESNYFGIGLFAVISFLVVAFLIVLFFGKKDEKKRKIDSLNVKLEPSNDNTFKETTPVTPLEMPVAENIPEPITPIAPVAPVNYDIPVAPVPTPSVEPTPISVEQPVNLGVVSPVVEPQVTVAPVTPMPSIKPINIASTTPVTPAINEPTPIINNQTVETVRPIIEETVAPIINEPVINRPVTPIISEPTYSSVPPINTNDRIVMEPTRFDIPTNNEPKIMEPIKITIPEEPVKVNPIVEPVVTAKEPTYNYTEPRPIIEEPVINETYYKPVEKVEPTGINVPNIDFDAIAKSISQELDELENSTNKNNTNHNSEYRVNPTPEPVRRPTGQFSSVYVSNGPRPLPPENMDMPKKIDLPTRKEE